VDSILLDIVKSDHLTLHALESLQVLSEHLLRVFEADLLLFTLLTDCFQVLLAVRINEVADEEFALATNVLLG
jgi:hypothetical protein